MVIDGHVHDNNDDVIDGHVRDDSGDGSTRGDRMILTYIERIHMYTWGKNNVNRYV